MNHTLALDLGTKTGFAYFSRPSESIMAGTWILETPQGMRYAKKLRMDRRLDPRVMALVNNLETLRRKSSIDWIFFEDVRFASSQAQAHLWASFRGAVWAFAHLNGIQVDCLDTGKLKKFATGSGAADKPAMAAALVRRFPDRFAHEKELVECLQTRTLLDDNAVDAIHLLNWAQSILK
jgi:Holliday junction resolvasome RuvABC endonuclease subunit